MESLLCSNKKQKHMNELLSGVCLHILFEYGLSRCFFVLLAVSYQVITKHFVLSALGNKNIGVNSVSMVSNSRGNKY